MKTCVLLSALLSAPVLSAAPPAGKSQESEVHAKRAHMMLVVAISDVLELDESQALRLSEKLKVFEEKRRPVRQSLHEALRQVKSASDGDAAALAALDASIQRVFEGRIQMAQLDREMYNALAEGQAAPKRAKLAGVLAKYRAKLRMHGAQLRRQ